ncbi:hypothetical protein [Pseudoxanthomonas sp.]|uniref:hypothetical protein n=1 Tax=Pseudoxanthomonas sp. TaxID=1871049 RepID=UPI0025F7B73C|nr:hypothetical protein [Pseudoxanthomonas sp.]
MKKKMICAISALLLAGSAFSAMANTPAGACTGGESALTCVTLEDRPNSQWIIETTTVYQWTFNGVTGTFGWSIVSVSQRALPGDRRQEQ